VNIEYDYETDTFWNTAEDEFCYPAWFDDARCEWTWLAIGLKKGLHSAQRSFIRRLEQTKKSFRIDKELLLNENYQPTGYSRYLDTQQKMKEANQGFTNEDEGEPLIFATGVSILRNMLDQAELNPDNKETTRMMINELAKKEPEKKGAWIQTTPAPSGTTAPAASSHSGSLVAAPTPYDGKPEQFTAFWA